MRKTLSVSSVHLYQKIALLLLTAVASIPSLYFLIDTEWYFLLIGVVLVVVLLRSSYLAVLEARKLKAKQFQTLVLEDEHFVFKNAPKGGGEQVSVAVHYDNIKSVGIQGASLICAFGAPTKLERAGPRLFCASWCSAQITTVCIAFE